MSFMASSILLRFISRRHPQHQNHQHQITRTFVEARVKWARDRGLDHAVEKEKHLKPMLALKNLIKSEPSKSLPVSVAAEYKTQLCLPTRTIEFIRKYPSVFQEFVPPGASSARPHVRLTPEILYLDDEEQLIYKDPANRNDIADRLLKLLMLTRVNKIPLHIIDRFQWDLGLPPDYVRTLLADYPDYFQVTSMKNGGNYGNQKPVLALELVCWTDDLAKSVMEKRTRAYEKGKPLAFPLEFSRGYELDKKIKKWLDDWQKLPYISPYEDAFHLQSKSDQAEKWTVAVLHELLHLLIPKKTDKDNILLLGDYLGLRSRFKSALINHPGIFYVSNKIRTHTVILREGYKRDLLVKKHPLMGMRYQYIHLMNKEKEGAKPTGVGADTTREKKRIKHGEKDGEEEENLDGVSGSEAEDASDDDFEEEDEDEDEEDEDEEEEDEDEDGNNMAGRCNVVVGRGRMARDSLPRTEMNQRSRSSPQDSSNRRKPNMVGDRVPTPVSRKEAVRRGQNGSARTPVRSRYPRSVDRLQTEKKGAST